MTAEEAAALRRLAVEWRDAWRAEMAGQHDATSQNGFAKEKSAVSPRRAVVKRNEADKFAAAIARHEFGRFYWNGTLAGELVQALEKRSAERKAGTAKPANRETGRSNKERKKSPALAS